MSLNLDNRVNFTVKVLLRYYYLQIKIYHHKSTCILQTITGWEGSPFENEILKGLI